MGDYGEAERLFRQVDRTARDLELVAAARYNLGNSKFRQGMAQRESDVQQALAALQASVAFYQGALELAPDDQEAARNIEVVRLAIKDILDQLQDQQREQQAQNEVAEQLRDVQQRQQAAAARSAQLGNDPPPEALRQLRQEQQQISEETAAAAQQLQEQAAAQPSGTPEAGDERRQDAIQKLQDAQRQQEQAAGRLEGQEPRSAASHQRAAAEDIAAARRALRDPSDAGTGGAPQEQDQREADTQRAREQPEQPVPGLEEQDQQPQDATAAQILDKERRDPGGARAIATRHAVTHAAGREELVSGAMRRLLAAAVATIAAVAAVLLVLPLDRPRPPARSRSPCGRRSKRTGSMRGRALPIE